jgi:hypothetical protein
MMSRLYIKGTTAKLEDMVVMLNNQPLTRLKTLKLELDENNNRVAHISFYPSSVEANVDAEVIEELPKKRTKSKAKK